MKAYGPDRLQSLICEVEPWPVSGLFKISEIPAESTLAPVTTGWGRLDQFLMLFIPAFMVITGTAGAGKSTWANQLVAQASYLHNWPVAIASFEMRIRPFITDTLAATYRDFDPKGNPDFWMEEKFVFISPQPNEHVDAFSIDWVIEKAEIAVIRHGIKILLIDPWNEIEHTLGRGETVTDYTGRAIQKLKKFGKQYDVLVIVVAHPAKGSANKDPLDITLYDIADSAHFANKADLGVVIARLPGSNQTQISVKKIRYQPTTGQPGVTYLSYDHGLRTFGQ